MDTHPITALNLVSDEIATYCESATTNEPQICQKIRQRVSSHPKAHWISGPVVGSLLKLITCATRAQRVLDIGTFVGYSAAYMASAGPQVRVTSLEKDPGFVASANELFNGDPIGAQIEVIQTEAGTWLKEQPRDIYDVVFFDSHRGDLMDLYAALTTIVRPGGILIMDNACLRGKALTPIRPWERATADFNRVIQSDPRLLTVLLPVRDGLLLAYRLS
jgi:predicted O-methyltransferase YrrM